MPTQTLKENSTRYEEMGVEVHGEPPAADARRCLHELLEFQAERTPHAVAVSHEGRTLTYRQLDERASQVAHYLLGHGVVTEDRVGVCISRSLEMIVAVFGVLKAGAAYVPLDPRYPMDRLAYIIGDANVRLVLSRDKDSQCLSVIPVQVLNIESAEGKPLARMSRLRSTVLPENLAYVIYTSGSTGRPKGVMVEHRSVANMAARITEVFSIDPSDRMLQFSSINWDTSAEEIFPCLASGATLALRTDAMAESVEGLGDGCRQAGVTLLNLPTAFWHMVMARDAAMLTMSIPSLRLLYIGGERAEKSALRAWGEVQGGRVQLFNGYGVTEAASASTIGELDPSREVGAEFCSVTIGSPIGNVRVMVLGDALEELPDRVTGELCIGGLGVARGYLDRPDLTAEKFVPDPYATVPGERLYKTGDLVQRRPNGTLDYIGRKDKQVKIRGYRIEPEEIESGLRECEGVVDCAVAVRINLAGEKTIVGYLVGHGGKQSDRSKLRKSLASRLPEYMIPGVFVWLESLPTLPNGKIDRAALPTPDWQKRFNEVPYVAPQTPVQNAVAEKWSSVLGIDWVGLEDNFFVLGGSSLSATQLISWVWATYGFRLPLRSIFDGPTVREMAMLVVEEQSHPSRLDLQTAISPVPRDGLLPLTPAEEMMLHMCRRPELSVALNLANAVRLKGELNEEALAAAFEEIVRRHESLRTTFRVQDGQVSRVISEDRLSRPRTEEGVLDEAVESRESAAERLATQEAGRAFDFARGPLFRYALHRFSPNDHVLTITVHHVVSDAWSLANLAGELGVLYEAFCMGRPSPLTPFAVQYADYAVWRNRELQGEAFSRLAKYWRKQLEGVPLQVCVPPDRPDPVESGGTARLGFCLSASLTDDLKGTAREQGTTLFTVLLSSLALLIGRLAGAIDVAIRVPVSLRNDARCEPLIGLFLDMIVMRVDLSCNPRLDELLKRVSRTTRDSLAHQELPFKMLVQSMSAGGGEGRPSPFPVTFNFINTPDDSIVLPGLISEPVDIHEEPATRSRLHVHMFEKAGLLHGFIVYQAGLYSRGRMEKLVEEFRHILRETVTDPARHITDDALAIV